jgi:hypothetical protein
VAIKSETHNGDFREGDFSPEKLDFAVLTLNKTK